jgi:hypothetical protein
LQRTIEDVPPSNPFIQIFSKHEHEATFSPLLNSFSRLFQSFSSGGAVGGGICCSGDFCRTVLILGCAVSGANLCSAACTAEEAFERHSSNVFQSDRFPTRVDFRVLFDGIPLGLPIRSLYLLFEEQVFQYISK